MQSTTSSRILVGFAAAAILGWVGSTPVAAEGFHAGRSARANAAGGVTGGSFRGVKGAQGGAFRGGAHVTDGQGNAAGARAAGFQGPNGAMGARAGKWSRSADGSVQHESGGAVSGAKGSAQSQGSFAKSSDGTYSGSRETSADSKSGYGYDGSTTVSNGSVDHSGTCTDPNGNTVPCSR
jgi:hypothetical protein